MSTMVDSQKDDVSPPAVTANVLASSSGSSVTSVVARGTTSTAPHGFFFCSKCKKTVPWIGMSSRHLVCKACHAAYKSLTSRWAKQRNLKTWWDALSEAEKTNWFIKSQETPAGTKRKFDALEYQEVSTEGITYKHEEFDEGVPWWKYKLENMMMGKELPAIEAEWKQLVEGPASEAIWVRGQWVVPRFGGLRLGVTYSRGQKSDTVRSAQVETSEQLTDLQRGGQSLRSTFAAQYTGLKSITEEAPHVEATEADQPVTALPQDIISQQVHREAT